MAMESGVDLAEVERAMKVREVLYRAMSGEIRWSRAAEVLGMTGRSVLRWRRRLEREGEKGLVDRRRIRPSAKRAPIGEVERVLRLYRERYAGFNARHFHGIAAREHGVGLSYTFVKEALQAAGLVRKRKARGRHRKRRERRESFGEMLHLDGSPHAWLALRPGEKQTLIAVLDDATSRVLYARLEKAEGTVEVMRALRTVFGEHGLPQSLYTDRASWAFVTPKAGGKVDRKALTQVGRALARLGVEHIPAYSPQARGRSERLNRTFQDRLVGELRVAGIAEVESANRYLREVFVPRHNAEFGKEPANPASAFVVASARDLDEALCIAETRTVGRDNTVVVGGVRLQIEKQPGRRTCAGLTVVVRRDLNGHVEVRWGKRVLGRYDTDGRPNGATAVRSAPPQAGHVGALAPRRTGPRPTEATGQITCQT
jgi:transposase